MPKPSTNKLIIFISILLVLVLAVLVIIHYDVQIKKFFLKRTDLNDASTENDTVVKHFVKQDTLKVDIDGLKNDTIQLPEEIIKIITSELNGFNWNEEFQEEDLYTLFHETIFAKQFPAGHSSLAKLIVVTFSNNVGNLDHAARGRISLFEFQKENQSWLMIRKQIAFGYGTEYGLEPLWCKLVRIGSNNKYALIAQTDYSGNGGHDMQTQAVYTWIGTSFKLVFDFTNYEYYFDYPKDIEYTEGYSQMRILKSNKTWFAIETKSEENKWNDKTPGAVKRYVFNGKVYVEAK
jgi:hypothetical protein